ncbi:MAG TPA: cation diffusion facilitator family transporter, partial [Salegentibacter sp.]|nr:cation diffusion facilitator family transporter [Salegentibacter sp.]
LKYSSRPPDENHPYGHGKAEPLITFAVVGFLVISATVIAYESIQHIQTPHKVPEPYTLIVLGAIVIIKEYFYRKVSRKSNETNSTSLKADAWHHRSDAITSLMAFIGISIALFMGKGYETADDWAALFASGFILYNAYLILRPALGEVMDEHMYDDMIGEIRKVSMNVPGVLDTEKCNVRKTGMIYYVDLHIIVNSEISVKKGHDIAHNVKNDLLANFPEIFDVLIHVEPNIEI